MQFDKFSDEALNVFWVEPKQYAPNEWRPPNTAPKDGTEFIAAMSFEGSEAFYIELVRWIQRLSPKAKTTGWHTRYRIFMPDEAISGWMPLPDLPKTQTDGQSPL
jgi:hypothetical protein